MGLQAVPGFIGQSGYEHPVELMRNITKALTGGGTGLVGNSAGFAMTPSGSAMQMTIAAGSAAILGPESAAQGSYFVWSDAAEVLPWPAHGGSNRMDALILRVIDTQYGSDSDTPQAEWEIVPGVNASPIPDAEFLIGGDYYRPGAWWRVADVLVGSTDNVMTATDIFDKRALAGVDPQRVSTGALFLQRVIFTASSNFNKVNYPNLKKINVKVLAGGGGGGGAASSSPAGWHSKGSGGGGGGYGESWISDASLGSTISVVVGAGGTAGVGTGNTSGGTGGASSFGTAVVTAGGLGGTASNVANSTFGVPGGSGGAVSAGDLRIDGQAGSRSFGNAGLGEGGAGANSQFGAGGNGVSALGGNSNALGLPGKGYGSGGGGAYSNASAGSVSGGAGAPGIVIVDVYV